MQIMNELGWNDAEADSFIGSDVTKLSGHIESVFIDSWRKAVNLFPKTYFKIKDFSTSELVSDINTGLGYLLLPSDFYSLYSFKMAGWQKAAETLLESSDSVASVQANEYTRGNIARPVCVKNTRLQDDDLVLVLEYYSLPKGKEHSVSHALYIPLIEPLSDHTQLNEKLFIPLAYLCASQVFSIFEKADIAKVLEAKAIELIG